MTALVETWPRERPKGTRMGRGHFKLIAAALRLQRPKGIQQYAQWRADVDSLANALAVTNQNFRRETFLAACGVES